jgi:putative two-component system response regulator
MALILIVDDEHTLRRALRRALERGGYTVAEASNASEARERLAGDQVDLMLCDINMPGESGLDLVRDLSNSDADTGVVMLTGIDDPVVAAEALAMGSYGYLVKPISPNEALINVSSALRRRELERERLEHVRELEAKVLTRTSALRDALARLDASEQHAQRDAVDRLVTALTLRSEETGAHIERVGRYAGLLVSRHGPGAPSEEETTLAGMLHDVGKIGIPDRILLKPGPLDHDEFEIIKRHPALGYALLANSDSPVLMLGAEIAITHHERWDGTGYPAGLRDHQIPISGRIAAIADVFDALTSDRVYRPALAIDEASSVMRDERGRHFDPDLLDLFLDSIPELQTIRAACPDTPGGPLHAASASARGW